MSAQADLDNSSERTTPLRKAIGPSHWWQRTSLQVKLLAPAVAVFIVALLVFVLFIAPTLNRFNDESLRLGFDSQAARVGGRIREVFTQERYVILSLAHEPEVQNYLQARRSGNAELVTAALRAVEMQFAAALAAQDVPLADLRLLDENGDQQALARAQSAQRGTASIVAPRETLTSERAAAHFGAIRALRPDEIYVSRPALTEPIGGVSGANARADLEFQIGAPVYLGDTFAGMVVASLRPRDFLLSALQPDESAYFRFTTLLLDQEGNPLAIATQTEQGSKVTVYGDPVFSVPYLPALEAPKGEMIESEGWQLKLYSFDDLARQGIHNAGLWLAISKLEGDTGTALLNAVRNITIGQSLFILIGVIGLALFVNQSIVRPINRMNRAAQRIAEGDRQVLVEVTNYDEIGQLGIVLNNMHERVTGLIDTLEARVRERTRNIEIAADIARRAAQMRDIDTLLQQTVEAIRERFGLYHVQVFLLDDADEFAVLHTSTGEAGRELLARNHRLAVGSNSIVGQVTEKRRTFITLDAEKTEVPHRFNPLLPLTRSEMALPLMAGDKLIGALDIQSVAPNAFDDEDVQIFQILADQIAIAIDNMRLLTQQQERAEQIDRLNRQLTRATWREYSGSVGEEPLAYRYDLLQVAPETSPPPHDGGDAPTNGGQAREALAAPLAIRGEVIGELRVSDNLALSREERAIVQAVAERVSLAVENIRLVEQTQGALARIEQLYESTRALNSAPDVQSIFQVVAERLSTFAFVDRVLIMLAQPEPVDDAPYYVFAHVWERRPNPESRFRQGNRLTREELPARWRVTRDVHQSILADVGADLAALPETRHTFEALGVRSLIISPLATSDRSLGALLVQSGQPNAFSAGFVQFSGALGEQLSIALENRYLYEAAQSEAERNRALAEASQIASQIGMDFEMGVSNLIRAVAPSAQYDRWWFGQVTLTPGGIVLRRVTAQFEPDSPLIALETLMLETHRGTIVEATRLNQALLVNDPVNHPALQEVEHASAYGKHIAIPVRLGSANAGTLLIGRGLTAPDLNLRDLQLASALASQIAVVLENQRLFNIAQQERATLQDVLDSLPTAVVVVDAATRQFALTNHQARALLGLDELEPYHLIRTATNTEYEPHEVPALRVLNLGEPIYAEDVTVITHRGERTDTLVNAVPIVRDGRIASAVAVFQDVTELRELENVLQESLRETTTLYEISRAIAAENDLVSILRVLAEQVQIMFAPDHTFIIFADARGEPMQTYRAVPTGDDGLSIVIGDENSLVPRSLLLTRETYTNSDITQNPELSSDPQLEALGVVSLGVFPLLVRSRIVGWLFVGFNFMRAFSPEERRTLGNMADQTAVAAESARLADQTAQALSTTTLLYEASLNISHAPSIQATLEVIREQAMYFEPSVIDVFLIRGERLNGAEWVMHWDALDPEADGQVHLDDPPLFLNDDFIHAGPLFIDNVEATSPEVRALLSDLPGKFMAHASVPMSVKGRVTGRISVGFSTALRIGRSEQQIFSTLADQGAIAIDNFLLVQQTQDSLDETATLYQTSRAISNAADLGEELNAVIDYAVQAIVSGAMIFRLVGESWEASDASVEIVASWQRGSEGLDLTGTRYTRERFPVWPEISTTEMVWIADLDSDEHPPVSDEGFYRTLGFRSVLVFPLLAAGTPVGAMLFGSDEPWPQTEREVRIYSSLADLVAISMERQRLLEQTERRARQLQLSAQIAQAAASILNLDELFDRTVNLIKDNFRYDHVQVFRISPDGTDARVVASTGEAGKRLIAIGHHLAVNSRSIIGQVTATGMPQIVADITDKRSIHRPNPYLPNTRAEMALPLIARNRILGALDVQSNQPGAFTRDDVAVLSSLADQIAIAIDNAELFELANQRVDEMRFLFDTTRAATALTGDDRGAVSEIARLIMQNLDADAASLMLVDETGTHLVPYSATLSGEDAPLAPHYDMTTPFFRAFAEEKEPIVVNDVPAVSQLVKGTGQLGQSRLLQQFQGLMPNAGSMVLVPLVSGDNFLGMIAAARKKRQGFNDDTLRLLQTLSSSLAAILQNARLLREVQQANVRLLELDKLKNQFLANMSHELRTPLNSIIGFSRVMLKGIDGPLTEMQEQDLTTIYDSGKHLLGLVNDILDQAKIEADKMEFTITNFSMIDLIRGVMSTAVGLVKDKPIRLHQEIEPELPPVWGDEFRTRQALLNLVSNAAKFTMQGSITVSAFRIEEDGQPFVQVSVTDTGIGISRDKLDLIFEPFRQAENSAARQYEGTGLGLPIAKKLVDKQGGRIWVISEPGVGSTFSFTMPVDKPETVEEPTGVVEG